MYKKALGSLVLINMLLTTAFVCVSGTKSLTDAVEPAFELSMEMPLDSSMVGSMELLSKELLSMDSSYIADERSSTIGIVYASASDQRVVDYGMLERPEPEWTVEEVLRLIAAGEMADDVEKYVISGNVISSNVISGNVISSNVISSNVLSDKPEELRAKTEDIALYCAEDLDLLLRIVEAEAGGEDEEGKLLVANVVLNRVNSEKFPDTVSEVVLQQSKGVTQFSPVSSGRIWKVKISEETISAVTRALCGEDISQGALYFAARKYADSSSMRWFDQKLTYLFTHGNHEFFF